MPTQPTFVTHCTSHFQQNEASLLAAIVQASDDAILSKTFEGVITSWNPAAERMFGYTAEEILGKHMIVLFPPDRLNEEEAILDRLSRGIATDHYESVRLHKNGTPILVSVTISPVKDAQGRIIGASSIARNITEQKRKEEELRLLSTVTAESPIGVIITDSQQRLLYANPAFERISGYTLQELHGRRPADLLQGPDTDEAARAQIRTALMAGESACGTLLNYRKDGAPYWVEMQIAPVRNQAGVVTHYVAVENDVTDRKQHEETLARVLKELENRNWELADAHDAALSATRTKSEFLANVSHELRTPLNGIIGIAQVLAYTALDANQQSYVRTIRQCAQGLIAIINDILDFSKIEAGKLQLETIPFSLRDVVEDSAAILATKAHEKGLEVCCVLPPLGTPIAYAADQLLGDPTRLGQIVTNLFSNAIKFTESGEIVLGVELLQETPTQARWRLYVRDTGIGIPSDRQEAIFESFTQADGSTTRRFGGTGLGLTICRQLTAQMGGQISLQSEVDRGSEFRVDIIFQKQSTLVSGQMSKMEALPGQYVLIVEDNAFCRSSLRDLLAAWGCLVTTAQNGSEALRILQQDVQQDTCPNLILLDMHLPDMDAGTFLLQSRPLPQAAAIPVVLLCPIGADGVAETMNDPAFAACLYKPVRQSELGNIMQRLSTKQENVSLFVTSETGDREETPPDLFKDAQSLRILLADDATVNQVVALEMLKQCGVPADKIKIVSDGREALEAWQQETFDLLLLDVQMPRMDGWETATAIRAREQQTGCGYIPIIAMTAYTRKEDMEKCLAAGMDDYLCKPLEIHALSAALERWSPQVSEPAALPPLNTDRLKKSTGNNRAIEQTVLNEFLYSTPKILLRCQLAIETQDGPGLQHWSHTLKGSSLIVGAEPFAHLCLNLENLGREDRVEQSQTEFACLKEEWTRLEQFIRKHLETEVDGNGIDGNGIDGNGIDGNGIDGNEIDGNGIDGNGIDGNEEKEVA